jgi:Fe-S oxidoreductase
MSKQKSNRIKQHWRGQKHQKAQAVSEKTQDIAEFLVDKDLSVLKTVNKKVT